MTDSLLSKLDAMIAERDKALTILKESTPFGRSAWERLVSEKTALQQARAAVLDLRKAVIAHASGTGDASFTGKELLTAESVLALIGDLK
jgi:hypothetical protein